MGCNPVPSLEGAPVTLGSCIRGLPSSLEINPGRELLVGEEGDFDWSIWRESHVPEKVCLAEISWPGDGGSWDGDPQPGPPCGQASVSVHGAGRKWKVKEGS